MSNAATIFCAQFSLVCLLGLQSQHVRDGKKLLAAITSLLLGITGWIITGIIAAAYQESIMSLVFFSFIAAGPCGITTSIWLHGKFHKEKK